MITKDRHPTEPLIQKGPGQPDAEARTEALDSATCHEMVVIIRPSFKKLCEQDACRAALLNHLLYWIAQKAKGQDTARIKSGEVYWYGSAEDICAGLDQSWSIWKVRNELKALFGSGLIGQRHNPVKGWDREYQYFIGEEQGQVFRKACQEHHICLRHLGLSADVLHLLKTVNAFDENRKCICGIQQTHFLKTEDAFPENSRAIPKDSTKVSPKVTAKETPKTESSTTPTDVADATTPSPSLSQTALGDVTDLATGGTQEEMQAPTRKASQPSGKASSSSTEVNPQGKPEMPEASQAWGPEKMVRITECLRFTRGEQGAFFSTQPTGKSGKSQRDRQLAAAKKIFAEIPTLTQDEYVSAYSEQNNEWWNREKGSLTVEDMAANTPRKVMRTVELLEKVRTRSTSIKRPEASTAKEVETKSTKASPPMTHDEACQLAHDAISAAKEHGRDIQVQAISLENGAWGIVVRWNTQYFEKPETMKSVKRWESALKEMSKIWEIEKQERTKRANNG